MQDSTSLPIANMRYVNGSIVFSPINEEKLNQDLQVADVLVNQEKYQEAGLLLQPYLQGREYPKSSHFWYVLGCAFRGMGRLNDAYDCLIKSTQSSPALVEAFYKLGRLEGESASFHRSPDIRRSHGINVLAKKEDIIYSCYDEQRIIDTLVNELSSHVNSYCVDIGAGDGITFSNTYSLFTGRKWKGLCVEPKKDAFVTMAIAHEHVDSVLINCYATPDNILDILKSQNVPKDMGFLSLDIDSYDYFVLEKILTEYTPSIICTEINELFPPPICFAVNYTSNFDGKGAVGQSISMLKKLLDRHDYSIVWLEYNNTFAVRNTCLKDLKSYKSLTVVEAYQKGLKERVDWKLKMPWNRHHKQLIMNELDIETTFSNLHNLVNKANSIMYIDEPAGNKNV